MFKPRVTVIIEIAPHDFREVRKELGEQIIYESFEPLDLPSPSAGALDRMLCSPYATIEKTMRSRRDIAELISAAVTDSLLDLMGATDT